MIASIIAWIKTDFGSVTTAVSALVGGIISIVQVIKSFTTAIKGK